MSGYVYRCLTIVEQAGGKPVAAGLIAELIPELTIAQVRNSMRAYAQRNPDGNLIIMSPGVYAWRRINPEHDEPMERPCQVIDPGPGRDVILIERDGDQALWFQVGPVFEQGGMAEADPVLWVQYQRRYLDDDLRGPVLIPEAEWRKLVKIVDAHFDAKRYDYR